jgi:hypothetical protein
MICPFFSRIERILPYSFAALSSKYKDLNLRQNSRWSLSAFWGFLLL